MTTNPKWPLDCRKCTIMGYYGPDSYVVLCKDCLAPQLIDPICKRCGVHEPWARPTHRRMCDKCVLSERISRSVGATKCRICNQYTGQDPCLEH